MTWRGMRAGVSVGLRSDVQLARRMTFVVRRLGCK